MHLHIPIFILQYSLQFIVVALFAVSTVIVQDWYHAMMRVLKELRKRHVDCGARGRQFREIGHRLQPNSEGNAFSSLVLICSLARCARIAPHTSESFQKAVRDWLILCRTQSMAAEFVSDVDKIHQAAAIVGNRSREVAFSAPSVMVRV